MGFLLDYYKKKGEQKKPIIPIGRVPEPEKPSPFTTGGVIAAIKQREAEKKRYEKIKDVKHIAELPKGSQERADFLSVLKANAEQTKKEAEEAKKNILGKAISQTGKQILGTGKKIEETKTIIERLKSKSYKERQKGLSELMKKRLQEGLKSSVETPKKLAQSLVKRATKAAIYTTTFPVETIKILRAGEPFDKIKIPKPLQKLFGAEELESYAFKAKMYTDKGMSPLLSTILAGSEAIFDVALAGKILKSGLENIAKGAPAKPEEVIEAKRIFDQYGADKNLPIREAYRQLAKQYHPDIGGSVEDMSKINASYNILTSPVKQPNFLQKLAAKLTEPLIFGKKAAAITGLIPERTGISQKTASPIAPAEPVVSTGISTIQGATPSFPIAPTEAITPIEAPMALQAQKAKAHIIARELGYITPLGETKPQYRRLAKAMTGKKSLAEMTEGEADIFIDAMQKLKGYIDTGQIKTSSIPTRTTIVPKEFWNLVPQVQEIGFIERFRPSFRVFEKMGLFKEVFEPAFETEVKMFSELKEFKNDLKIKQKEIKKIPDASKNIFQYLDGRLSQDKLSPKELKLAEWGKEYFDKWADDLKLPLEKRRTNYITHIFEKNITQDLQDKNPIDPDIIKVLDFVTPKNIFNPYLQERIGKKIGLKEDFFAALEAYEAKALKMYHYDPLIKKLRIYEQILPPNSAKYLRSFINRMTNRPTKIDQEINETIKSTFEKLKIQKLPFGDKLKPLFTQGNVASKLGYLYTGIMYDSFLGFRPKAAIKNLGQQTLTIADTGAINYFKGRKLLMTEEGKNALSKSLVLKSRDFGILPNVDEGYIKGLESKVQKAASYLFRKADINNVKTAFLAGYSEAKSKGLPTDIAVKRGDEVARRTQYLYTKLAGSEVMQPSLGKVIGLFTTWPANYFELLNDWVFNKPSQVYLDYKKTTGIDVKGYKDGKIDAKIYDIRKRAIYRYLAIVLAAYVIKKKTTFKALNYTGITALESVSNVISGELAGLKLPANILSICSGIITDNQYSIDTAKRNLKPTSYIILIKELLDIFNGKKDWLDLFIYTKSDRD